VLDGQTQLDHALPHWLLHALKENEKTKLVRKKKKPLFEYFKCFSLFQCFSYGLRLSNAESRPGCTLEARHVRTKQTLLMSLSTSKWLKLALSIPTSTTVSLLKRESWFGFVT
jgi:hypothetical protein